MSWRYHLALKSGGVIAVARPHDHLRRPRRTVDADPDLSPLSVASLVGRRIAQAVLMAQFQRHARGRLLHPRSRVDEKRTPAGQPRYLIEDHLPARLLALLGLFAQPGAAYVHAVNLNVGFLQPPAEFVECAPRSVVLSVGDDQQRAPSMPALPNLLDAHVDRIVERSLALRGDHVEPQP